MPRRLVLVAGEVSGDLHGATLVQALRAADHALEFSGLGGERMRAAGVQPLEAELSAFIESVRQHGDGTAPANAPASGTEARRAIELALLIERKIRARAKRWSSARAGA